MTLYNLIDKVDKALTPKTHFLKDFIIYTSIDDGSSLLTDCHRKSEPLKDHIIPTPTYTLISFDKRLDIDFLELCYDEVLEIPKINLTLRYNTNIDMANLLNFYSNVGFRTSYLIDDTGDTFEIRPYISKEKK